MHRLVTGVIDMCVNKKPLVAALLAYVMICTPVLRAEEVKDYSWFLNALIDLDRLIEPTAEGIQCKQASSYDRASRYDKATGQYLDWAANADAGQYIRVEKETEEHQMNQEMIRSQYSRTQHMKKTPKGILS